MKSVRQKQVAEMLRRSLSMILQAEGAYIYGQDKLVTVTGVDITPDYSIAKVYISAFRVEDKNEIINLLTAAKPHLHSRLAQRIGKKIRRLPELHFYTDDLVDEMYRVNKLLDGLKD